jgi:hypothetical protein
MRGQYSQFRRTWPSYAVFFGTLVVSLAFAPIIPFDKPWPTSLIIALLALLLLIWIPMINWVVRQRQGIAWSIRDLPSDADAGTRIARLALWNRGFRAVRNRSGANNDPIVLRIEGRDPTTTIVAISVDPTQAEPVRFDIRVSPDHRRAELTTREIAVRRGAVFTIEHTGAHASDLTMTGDTVTYFSPDDVVTIPTWNSLLKRPSAIVGVLILLGLTAFWIHGGRSELIVPLNGVILGLVVGTISSIVIILLQTPGSRWQSEHSMMRLIGLPVGYERFFENG